MTTPVIDVDSHLTEPADLWTSRVPSRYVDRVPQMTSPGGWPTPFPAGPATLAECPPAAYDAAARLAYLDEVGIWAQVLYPNVAGFGSQKFLKIKDRDLQFLCVRAYNDFLRDWASAD